MATNDGHHMSGSTDSGFALSDWVSVTAITLPPSAQLSARTWRAPRAPDWGRQGLNRARSPSLMTGDIP